MESISVVFDIGKFADFRFRGGEVGGGGGEGGVIFKIFGKGGEPYMGGLYGEHFIET